MPTRIRKIRKQRGSRSHGWGQSAGHRGAGSRGGVGNTGGHKHRWTYTVVNEPDYFRKHGFHHYSVESVSLNVGELDQISKTLLSTGKATKMEGSIFIDLDAMGVDKLLGSGKVFTKLIVRVKSCSSLAEKKLNDMNGKILKTR